VSLFVNRDPTNAAALPSAALRLHFRRIAVENCGGEIDYDDRERGAGRCGVCAGL